ncbi:IclR family transcriptional regulator [Pokkaliibacter sp. CJK22405]|uniref:IclR family transcriptional regulator n=1 Tax=Pokkaliibacter sp. CJK22405 TaxID=3384615 RepID=UPI003984A881
MAQDRVEAVERALVLLDCFNEQQRTLSLAELATTSGFYKSTILRLMRSLEMFGYVQRDNRGLFSLGGAVRRLSRACNESTGIEPMIRPSLLQLREQSGETTSFYVREGMKRICLYRENALQEVRHHLEEGISLPLGVGAAGRLLRAFTDDDPMDHHIRRQGWTVSLGERMPEVGSVAVPTYNRQGDLLGCLSISGPISRFSEERCQAHIQTLREEASRLKLRLL